MANKSKVIRIRIDAETEQAVKAFIESESSVRNISDLIRKGVGFMMASDQPQLTREMANLFEAWRKEFHGVGSNLNQIAYKMNANHPLSTNEILEVLEALKAHFKMLDDRFWNLRHDLEL